MDPFLQVLCPCARTHAVTANLAHVVVPYECYANTFGAVYIGNDMGILQDQKGALCFRATIDMIARSEPREAFCPAQGYRLHQ